MIYGYVCDYADRAKGCSVYFIRDGMGNVKIGKAKDGTSNCEPARA